MMGFFESECPDDLDGLELDEMQEGIFNEWLLFEAKLKNGRSLLEEYCLTDPEQAGEDRLKIYRDLIKTNHLGLFEALLVHRDEGLRLRDLQSGQIYDVKEKSGTHHVDTGNVFYGRVAKIGSQWELVGANGFCFPVKRMTANFRAMIAKDKHQISVKEVFRLAGSAGSERGQQREKIDPNQARLRLAELLAQHGLDEFVTVKTIEQWCHRLPGLEGSSEIFSLIFGLGRDRLTPASLNDLMEAVRDVYNTSSQKALGGKSPQEKSLEDPDRKPELVMDTNDLGGGKWWKSVKEAHGLMQKQKYVKAVGVWQEVFGSMQKEHAIMPDIYRFYANKAVCHFACGEEAEGRKMLELALRLNPNYDFAQSQIKRLQAGKLNSNILYGRLQAAQERMQDLENPLNKWNPDNLGSRFSTPDLLQQFADFGISLDEASFRALVSKYVSSDELAEKELRPKYKGPRRDEDFVWAATSVLWERLAPDCHRLEQLEEEISRLEKLVFGARDKTKRQLPRQIAILKKYVQGSPAALIRKWKKNFEYPANAELISDAVIEMFSGPDWNEALKMAELFRRRTADPTFLLPALYQVIADRRDFHGILKDVIAKMPGDSAPYLTAARAFKRLRQLEQQEAFLRQAVTVAERGLHPGRGRSEKLQNLSFTLEHLEDFYHDQGRRQEVAAVKKKRERIVRELENLEVKRFSRANKNMSQLVIREAEEQLKDDSAVKYFDYISSLGINFATKKLTVSSVEVFGQKLGRNDPCPCGSGKKYKKCHGQ